MLNLLWRASAWRWWAGLPVGSATLRREILHDLDVAARMLHDESGKTPAFDRVFKTKANLSRMWYDDRLELSEVGSLQYRVDAFG